MASTHHTNTESTNNNNKLQQHNIYLQPNSQSDAKICEVKILFVNLVAWIKFRTLKALI